MVVEPRSRAVVRLPLVGFRLLEQPALRAMLADELALAAKLVGQPLPAFFLEEKWLWRIRLNQLRESPEAAPWLVRAVVLQPNGPVVGHAGFHGPPDAQGVVEVGYTIAPEHRGHGYAHAVLRALLDEAASLPAVSVVRATIGPDNLASLAVVRRGAFIHVGEQWDEVDGIELIFEKEIRPRRAEG
jgi:RimJ/RimL family protein N-acetyltransferase